MSEEELTEFQTRTHALMKEVSQIELDEELDYS